MAEQIVSIDLKGVEELAKALDGYNEKYKRNAVTWMVRSLTNIVGTAKRKLTWNYLSGGGGGRDTGHLSRKIDKEIEIKKDEIIGRAGTNVKYAKFQEGYPKAPREHFLPYTFKVEGKEVIRIWAERHGIDTKKTWGLMVGGEKSIHPFLKPAVEENAVNIRQDLEKIGQ